MEHKKHFTSESNKMMRLTYQVSLMLPPNGWQHLQQPLVICPEELQSGIESV